MLCACNVRTLESHELSFSSLVFHKKHIEFFVGKFCEDWVLHNHGEYRVLDFGLSHTDGRM